MPLLRLDNVTHGYVGPPLLDGVDFVLRAGERVCLLGRNGTGKSTMLRLIAGEIEPDQGELTIRSGVRIAYLPQEVPREMPGTILHRVTAAAPDAPHYEIQAVLSRMSLPGDLPADTLSAGMKRRVLLAEALAPAPDVLLLDEPTNHLDIEAIRWLEDFLLRAEPALLFVTHDRTLLQRVATRTVELDRGRLTSYECDYATYLKRREIELKAEAKRNAEFDKKLAQEETWIRQGILARRTRNEGRVRRLMEMRHARGARREVSGKVRMQLQRTQASGRLVIKADNISKSFGENTVVSGFSAQIMRGDRIGIIGPNGCGKTTLLRLLLDDLPSDGGNLRHGTELQVAYFDQLHAQLDLEASVADNVSGGNSTVRVGGGTKHILGYLQDFLFTPDRARSPVKQLSGGERNRLLLARMFTKPSNVLVLDEPTNDLDTETLELLEEQLGDYDGTLLVVSHDRTFLNNVVTETFVFEGDGEVRNYAGGYDDYLVQQQASQASRGEKPGEAGGTRAGKSQAKADRRSKAPPDHADQPKRLTYKEKMELEALPAKIETFEAQIAKLHAAMADPAFYQRGGEEIARMKKQLDVSESELAELYQRWESLEARK